MKTPESPNATVATPGEHDAPPRGRRRERQSSFLSVLGHELRNHVAPIQNALFLMRRNASDAAMAPLVDLVERQLQAIIQSYEQLAEAERVNANEVDLRRERVDLVAQVQAALATLRPVVSTRASRVHAALPDTPVVVEVDAARTAQAIVTIIRNALNFTADSGEVWIDVATDANDATVRVRDSGGGMEPEQLAHVFEFFAARGQATHSLGINLAVAHRIVNLHGGSLTAESAGEGQGSEFAMRIPLAGNHAPADASCAAGGKSPANANTGIGPPTAKRVLIADDSAPLRETLSTVLRGMGHDVRIAIDGEEALAIAQAWRPDFALLDIYMPKLTGFVVARELRTRFPSARMRLVMMSGHDLDESTLLDAGQAGFDHCIDKAFTLEALERLLRDDDGGAG
jgi:CheY-like chemotaxis protein